MEHSHPRFIPLQGCINFRDLGGYRTRNGQTVKWRKLFRSDSIHHMTPDDIDYICNNLGLVTVIDLRNTDEVQRDGDCTTVPSSVQYHHVPLLEQLGMVPYHESEDPALRLADI